MPAMRSETQIKLLMVVWLCLHHVTSVHFMWMSMTS